MAIHSTAETLQATPARSSSSSLTDVVRAMMAPLASLKLTVILLALSVFVVWVITLEQATIDIWELKHKHFGSAFVYVPFSTFLPPKWYPDLSRGGAGFFLPSGFTLIVAMLINLTAAHMLRFRLQASGARLLIGIVVLSASAGLTWAIIFNGQDADGFQGQPPIPWQSMWRYLQIAVLGLGIGSVYASIAVGNDRNVERIGFGMIAVVLFGLLGISLYFGERAFIGDSAMRILWQLSEATIAAMAVLAGCILLFKRKAGIVLLHLGIAGLLLNEIYVTATNEEYRVSFEEGQSVHHAIDLRDTEFVVLDRSDSEFDEMTVLPGKILASAESVIDDPRLPFKINCLEYHKNCDIVRVGPHADNQADQGIGQDYIAVAQKPAAGADANAGVDKAGAYVELIDRASNKPIGVYLASQAAYEQGLTDTVSIGKKNFQIGLRFKTVYTPYALKLNDTQAKYYVGTDIPSWFSSDIEISDEQNGITSNQKIWMNNPLRYRDETFYQVTYQKDEESGNELSGIQIVRNRGWMIPYVCCMFVVVGLVAQFQQTLTGFLMKSGRKLDGSETATATQRARLAAWLPTILLLGVGGLYFGSQLAQSIAPTVTKAEGSEIRLDLLGKMPVTYGGRVQPLDSYARNLARQLSNREEVKDGLGFNQPAIRWLADVMFGASGADEYEILRIEDLNVQNALDLPRRKGLKYKFSEIRDANAKLMELLMAADNAAKTNVADAESTADGEAEEEIDKSVFHQRLNEVFNKSRLLIGATAAFSGTEGRYKKGDLLERLEVAANVARTKSAMPFALPTGNEDEPWMPLSLALERQWLGEMASELEQPNMQTLASHLITSQLQEMKPELVKQQIISSLLRYEEIVEGLSARFGLDDPDELREAISRNWHLVPEKLYADELAAAEKMVDFHLQRLQSENVELVGKMLAEINGGTELSSLPDAGIINNLAELKQAYLDGDAADFNARLEQHLTAIENEPPADWSRTSQGWEIAYNYFSPFHVAMCLYLAGFVVTVLSWIGLRDSLNRAAFWLLCLALLVHIGGIVARIVISGRPPITNLYSSFVVVTACCVLALLVIERRTRLGLGNLLAGSCGFLTLLYAWTMSIDQGDTFTVLRAVLDTQFWLTTHVIIINLGYAATLVAGLVGIVYLITAFVIRDFDKATRRTFANIIYGTVCFALLFSFFGTVLGGLWADDSWGRFWGWDPKENGALMIVLWNAVILHSRWAGIIRERGLAALAVFGNVVTIWSWEGVNQLGVGLHAYGGVSSGAAAGSIFFEPLFWLKAIVLFHITIALFAGLLPLSWFRSHAAETKPTVA